MADKKKIQVVSEAREVGPASESGFDFTKFSEQFYPDGATAASGPSSADLSPTRSGTVGGGSGCYTTAYQARKTSIVAGVTADQLVVQHRKSLADIAGGGGVAGKPAGDISDLNGVTLSKRHSLATEEYEGGLQANAYQQLDGYEFDDHGNPVSKAEAAATAA